MWLVGLQTAPLPCDAPLQSALPLCTMQEAGVTTVCTLASAQRYVTVYGTAARKRAEWAGLRRWGLGTQRRPGGCLLNEQRCTERWLVCPWHLRGWPTSHAPTWGRQAAQGALSTQQALQEKRAT